jgi:hypothetical protein
MSTISGFKRKAEAPAERQQGTEVVEAKVLLDQAHVESAIRSAADDARARLQAGLGKVAKEIATAWFIRASILLTSLHVKKGHLGLAARRRAMLDAFEVGLDEFAPSFGPIPALERDLSVRTVRRLVLQAFRELGKEQAPLVLPVFNEDIEAGVATFTNSFCSNWRLEGKDYPEAFKTFLREGVSSIYRAGKVAQAGLRVDAEAVSALAKEIVETDPSESVVLKSCSSLVTGLGGIAFWNLLRSEASVDALRASFRAAVAALT